MAKATSAKKAATKAASRKAAPKKAKEYTIKYEDKSKGQSPELVTIWNKITELFKPYVKGNMEVMGGSGGQYTLVNRKPYEDMTGRLRNELWFAGALIQKGYVGFYYMPVHATGQKQTDFFKPELLKCLKGKSCFHIKKDDPQLYGQMKEALKLGYEAYRKTGWI